MTPAGATGRNTTRSLRLCWYGMVSAVWLVLKLPFSVAPFILVVSDSSRSSDLYLFQQHFHIFTFLPTFRCFRVEESCSSEHKLSFSQTSAPLSCPVASMCRQRAPPMRSRFSFRASVCLYRLELTSFFPLNPSVCQALRITVSTAVHTARTTLMIQNRRII